MVCGGQTLQGETRYDRRRQKTRRSNKIESMREKKNLMKYGKREQMEARDGKER